MSLLPTRVITRQEDSASDSRLRNIAGKGGSRPMLGYLVGASSFLLITAARWSLSPLIGKEMPLLLYVLAVLSAAALGGFLPGIVTGALCAAVGSALFVGFHHVVSEPAEVIRVSVFAVICIAISFAFKVLHKRTAFLAESRDRIERMALTDELTGLANRRAFIRDLHVVQARAARDGAAFTIVAVDVDSLKRVNDSAGHEVGDQLLVAVARALKATLRASDVAFRIGGDEFVGILNGLGAPEAAAPIERLRSALDDLRARFLGAGASIGSASYPNDDVHAEAVFRLADKRMYAEKAAHGDTYRFQLPLKRRDRNVGS